MRVRRSIPKRRRWRAATVAGAVALTVVLASCGSDDSESSSSSGSDSSEGGTITIGFLGVFSGPSAALGPPEETSLKLAVKAINDGGGVKIGDKTYDFALKSYDTAYDPAKAVTAARQAIDKDGVTFLSVQGGGVIPGISPVVGDKALISASAIGGDTYLDEKYPTTVETWFDMPVSLAAILKELKPELETDAPRLALMYTDDAVGKGLAEASTEQAEEQGFEVSTTLTRRDVTDLAPVLTKVLAEKPDAIDFGPTPVAQYLAAVKTARELGYKGRFLFSDVVFLTPEAAKHAAGGYASPIFQNFDSELGQEWVKGMEKLGPLQGWAALSHDNLLLIKAAMEKAQSIEPTEVREALPDVRITDGLLGDVGYKVKPSPPYPEGAVGLDIPFPVTVIKADGTLEEVAQYSAGDL